MIIVASNCVWGAVSKKKERKLILYWDQLLGRHLAPDHLLGPSLRILKVKNVLKQTADRCLLLNECFINSQGSSELHGCNELLLLRLHSTSSRSKASSHLQRAARLLNLELLDFCNMCFLIIFTVVLL